MKNRDIAGQEIVSWRVSVYLLFLYLYFFFNSFGLPLGLEYTTLLSPLLYLWLIKNNQKWVVTRFVLISLPFVFFHMMNGVINPAGYVTSYGLLMAVYLASYAFYLAVCKCNNLGALFRKLIVVNFWFAIIALPLRNSEFSKILWWNASTSIGDIPRLRLLTYEASYYSTLLVPFFLFSYFSVIRYGRKRDYSLLFLTTFPLLLSFSFGVIGGLAISLAIVQILYIGKLYRQNSAFYLGIFPLLLVAITALVLFTPFIDRLTNVLSGQDMSGTGRVYWSNLIAVAVASEKSLVWGVGFGQVKEYFDVMSAFMLDADNSGWMDGRLYNSLAEIFALTGAAGLSLKLGLEAYFFVVTKPYQNYFRLSLFIFMFVYQFTGSYPSNLAEYAIWIFAFSKAFPDFDVRKARAGGRVINKIDPDNLPESTRCAR